MPSPIAHLTAGYAIYAIGRSRLSPTEARRVGPLPYALLITAGFSMLPDIDAVLGVLAGDFRRFHNNATHSLFAGLLAAAVLSLWLRRRGSPNARLWFVLAWVSYALHVLMDSATLGRGVMALWPLSSNRYNFPIPLFYGVQWANGLVSIEHLMTLVTELLFTALVALLLYFTGVVKGAKAGKASGRAFTNGARDPSREARSTENDQHES